jgi:peroxisomal 3,2-trans-enoyl-CoA isomerase
MLPQLLDTLRRVADDPTVKAVVLTGTGDYYSSGVDFISSFPVMRPSLLIEHLRVSNQRLFDTFLNFPKPIIVAANGPAIGGAVTAASLCDAILAVPSATFHTPFSALGIVPEGCSSYWFPRLMGTAVASRMLGREGWKPTATEACAAGLVTAVVPAEKLQAHAQALAEQWICEGRPRAIACELEKLRAVNAEESRAIAQAFVAPPFLTAMHLAAKARNKTQLAAVFWALLNTQPIWSRL